AMPLNPHTPAASGTERLPSGEESVATSEQRAADSDRLSGYSIHAASTPAPDAQTNSSPAGLAPAGPALGQTATAGEASASRTIRVPKVKSGLPLRKRPHEARRIAIEVFPQSD